MAIQREDYVYVKERQKETCPNLTGGRVTYKHKAYSCGDIVPKSSSGAIMPFSDLIRGFLLNMSHEPMHDLEHDLTHTPYCSLTCGPSQLHPETKRPKSGQAQDSGLLGRAVQPFRSVRKGPLSGERRWRPL